MLRSRLGFERFAWGLLAYNLAVILWGAFVRATGSGAGCGNHWPLCNGEALPRPEAVETLIELTHRLTSGIDGLLVLLLVAWAFRAFPRRHPVRLAAVGSLVFLVSEALLGAGLVRFELVADNASLERGFVMAAHLVNTFLLLAWLAATAAWARLPAAAGSGSGTSRRPPRLPLALSLADPATWVAVGGVVALLVLGVSGAIAALGDTLFPAATFREGLAQDFSPTAHLFLRLRVWHPALALVVGLYVAYGATWLRRRHRRRGAEDRLVDRYTVAVLTLFALQIALGVVNVLLAAPVWMQLVHLLAADLVWIAWILLALAALHREPPPDVAGSGPTIQQG